MKLTEKQFEKIEHLMPKTRKNNSIKLSVFVCNAVHHRKWLQMEDIAGKVRKMAHNIYEIQQMVTEWNDTENI